MHSIKPDQNYIVKISMTLRLLHFRWTHPLLLISHFSELPKQHPVVVGIQSRYRPSDTIQGNCTSYNSKPVANLTWTINDVPVRLIVVHLNCVFFLSGNFHPFIFGAKNLYVDINFGSYMLRCALFGAISTCGLKCFHSLRRINCLFIWSWSETITNR